jgi:hypothetical protein
MGYGGGSIGVAEAAENAEVLVGWGVAEECSIGDGEFCSGGGSDIYEISCGVGSFGQKMRWEIGLN